MIDENVVRIQELIQFVAPVGERVVVCPEYRAGHHLWCPVESAGDLMIEFGLVVFCRCTGVDPEHASYRSTSGRPSTMIVSQTFNRVSGREGTTDTKKCSNAVSIFFRGQLEVGRETPKSSARVSSVWSYLRYRRVVFQSFLQGESMGFGDWLILGDGVGQGY